MDHVTPTSLLLALVEHMPSLHACRKKIGQGLSSAVEQAFAFIHMQSFTHQTPQSRSRCFRNPPTSTGHLLKAVPARPWFRRNKAPTRIRADLGGALDSMLTYGALGLSLAAALFAILPGKNQQATKQQASNNNKLDDQDNFRWGLMGFISFFPLFNWLAWVFAAIDSDSPRPYYYFAALYTVPLLRNGFDFDWFTWAMLGAGALHVQMVSCLLSISICAAAAAAERAGALKAARIAATEPELQAQIAEQLQPLNILKTTASAAGTAVSVALGIGERPNSPGSQQLGGGEGRQQQQGRQREVLLPGGKRPAVTDVLFPQEEVQEDAFDQQLLEDFDARLQQRDQQKDQELL